MYRSRLLFGFSVINLIAVFVCIMLLPPMVAFKFDSNFIVSEIITRWYNIIIPALQVIACMVIMIIDFKEDGAIPHLYRYIITYVAVSIATYYTWIMLDIQFENLSIGDQVIAPMSVLILVPIALFMVAYGYYQCTKKYGAKSIFAFKFVKENPIVWKKVHKVAGFLSSLSGMIIIVLAILNDTIIKCWWMYLVAVGVWVLVYYCFTFIYAYKESRFYIK